MTSSREQARGTQRQLFPVPLTLEGASVLHQVARFRWAEWRKLTPVEKQEVLREAGVDVRRTGQRTLSASSLSILRRISRITRPNRVRGNLSARRARLNWWAWV